MAKFNADVQSLVRRTILCFAATAMATAVLTSLPKAH
jgi:hypothetical protein